MTSSIYFLHPYLKDFKLFQDLCYFIDYLNIDIDAVYSDMRNKYKDHSKLSDEATMKTFEDAGFGYISNFLDIYAESKGQQILGILNLLQLLKGDIRGVEILSNLLNFEYVTTQWWEQTPLGLPNTARIGIYLDSSDLVTDADFTARLVEFFRNYLYPTMAVRVYIDTNNEVGSNGAGYFELHLTGEEVPSVITT